jgi:carboxyl-terminal processing protease
MNRLGFLTVSGAALLLVSSPAAPQSTTKDNSDTWKQLNIFSEVFERVRSDYVEPITDDKLIQAAINGMLSGLDPHSRYLDEASYKEFQTQTQGEFGGLGMEVTQENGVLKVVSPIDDTPAARAGIKPSDLIVQIDGQSIIDLPLQEAVDRMRGPVDTEVKLTIRREGRDPFDVTLKRAEIKVEAVKARVQDNVDYIRITSFSENAAKGLNDALDKARQQLGSNLAGVVLDLRNDPGGLLDQAVAVAGDFLDGGEVVSIRGRRTDDSHEFDAKPNGDRVKNLPVVVLINGGSASASEIVAGALQDRRRAIVLGTKSFGKGSVQTVIPVPGNGAMLLTTARYYTPSGRSIQAKGIDPDIVVEPAKLERIAEPNLPHEADLRRALANPDAANAAKGAAPQANVPPGTTPTATAQKGDAKSLDPITLGSAEDYQLARAFDLIKAISMFNERVVN